MMGASEEIKRDLLAALDERELVIIGLVDYYEFKMTEVGRLLGISKNLVFDIRKRALEKIRKIYTHYEFKQIVAVNEVARPVRLGVNNQSHDERAEYKRRRDVARETNYA